MLKYYIVPASNIEQALWKLPDSNNLYPVSLGTKKVVDASCFNEIPRKYHFFVFETSIFLGKIQCKELITGIPFEVIKTNSGFQFIVGQFDKKLSSAGIYGFVKVNAVSESVRESKVKEFYGEIVASRYVLQYCNLLKQLFSPSHRVEPLIRSSENYQRYLHKSV